MKVEFLKNLGLEQDIINQIQAESGKDVTNAKNTLQSQIEDFKNQIKDLTEQISQRDTNFAELQKQLESAGQSATKLKEVQEQFDTLNSKYTTETENYKKQLADQQYKYDINQLMSGIKFSSKAAKRDVLNTLMNERLPIHDGQIIGFDQFIAKRKEEEPDSFMSEKEETPPPIFAPHSNPQQNQPKQDSNPFGFHFMGV